ncbi:MAG TPA: DEAD/DEAH box helicase [Puia sp.]|nr:DEAD/DEAH box helicase [Puia sp.]
MSPPEHKFPMGNDSMLDKFTNHNTPNKNENNNLPLRPYQRDCLGEIRIFYLAGKCRLLVSISTGTGKTIIFAWLIKQIKTYIKKSKCRVLVIAHTTELLDQNYNKILMCNPNLDIGRVDGDHKKFDKEVVICSIQAAAVPANLEKLLEQNFDLLIYDEAHRAATASARYVIEYLGFGKGTKKLLVGFTATAFRNDGKGLGEVFDHVVYEKDIKYFIEHGYLVPPIGIKIATDIDLTGVKISDGDFQAESLAKIMDTPEMNQLVFESWQKNAATRRTICFTTSVQHAKNLNQLFKDNGVASEAVYGDMPKDDRTKIIEDFKSGIVQVLLNASLLVEGFDSCETSCVIITKITKSRVQFCQMAGRGLRLAPWMNPPKKDVIILDFSSKGHNLCTTAVLYHDFDIQSKDKQAKKELLDSLPRDLNRKLKLAIIEVVELNSDLLSQSFNWEKRERIYFIKGVESIKLEIRPQLNKKYEIVLSSPEDYQVIRSDLTFEYAFSVAEEFAKRNRKIFVFADREAEWRKLPISEQQIAIFKEHGYTAGIGELRRGQAREIINSGVLRKNKRYNK